MSAYSFATVQIQLNKESNVIVRAEEVFVGNGVMSLAPRILYPSMTITKMVEFLVYNILQCIQGLMIQRNWQIMKK